MKQNPLSAEFQAPLIGLVTIALALFVSACATLPGYTSSEVQLNLNPPQAERASLININTARAQELERLPGIGEGIAERIIAHRERYGHFRRAEHLMMVHGISDRKFRAIRPMIRVE